MSLRNYKKIVSASAPAITALGLHHIFDKNYSGRGHILMFHRVVPKTDRLRVHNHESLEIDPEQLEQTILFFKKRQYQFLSIEDVPQFLRKEQDRKFVVFTFDDGYLDNLQHAFPILKKYSVPFIIYITNNFINGNSVMWWYLLEEIILSNDHLAFSWNGKLHDYPCESLSQKESTFEELRRLITTELYPSRHLDQLNEIFAPYITDLYQFTRENAMSWSQVKTLANDPIVSIGAHTANHFPLKQLTEQELIEEVVNSRVEIELKIGKKVNHFAYPFGKKIEAGQREYEFVENHGFDTAVTTNIGNIFSEHIHHLNKLPRINVNALTTKDVLELQISGMVPFFKNGKRRVNV